MADNMYCRSMDLVSPCSHGEHPFELAVAAASRALGQRSHHEATSMTRGHAEWRSMALRVPAVADASPCSISSWEEMAIASCTAARQPPETPAEQLLKGGLDVWDPSDKSCMERMEQLLSRKPKVAGTAKTIQL
jgi:hypothetical protein